MSLTVRPGVEDDLNTLVGFNSAMAAETEDKGLDSQALRRGIEYLLNHPDEGRILIAEKNGCAVGTLMLTFEWSEWRNGRFWWIQSVYVNATQRRQGIYRALHAEARCLARADSQSCGIRLYVEKDNTGAQQTYRRMGMRETNYRLYEEAF